MHTESVPLPSEQPKRKHVIMRALVETPVTTAIALTMVLVFVAAAVLSAASPAEAAHLETMLANSPVLVRERLWLWQLVTATFLHGSLFHLLVNVAPLIWLGRRLEHDIGSKAFLAFFLFASIFSYGIYDIADRFWSAWDPTIGASGCLYAFATFVVLLRPARTAAPSVLHLVLLTFVILDIAWFLAPTWMPWVNRIVHLAGVAFALLWWLLLSNPRTAHAE